MTELKNPPETHKVLSGSVLKLIALFTMMIDHTASVLLVNYRAAVAPLLRIGPFSWSLFEIFRIIGRCAFPLYAFLLVEGFIYTKNRKKYGINLFLFALISEIPWNLEHSGKWTYAIQNVFFTLFFGFLALVCLEKLRGFPMRQILSLLLITLVTLFFHADHGVMGFGLILLLYALREKPVLRTVIGTCFFGSPQYYWPPYLLMYFYNGKRGFIKGKVLKYVFYAAYPAHILILYFLKRHFFGY